MVTLPDPVQIAKETRTERLEQRIKPTVKKTIEIAAALTGTDTSDFVVMAAYDAALKRLETARVTELVGDDAERFFAALDRSETRAPTETMKQAMARYEKQVGNAIR